MKKIITDYLHGDEDGFDQIPENEFKDFAAYRNAANWAYELEFEVEIDMDTGDSKILSVDGHKVLYETE